MLDQKTLNNLCVKVHNQQEKDLLFDVLNEVIEKEYKLDFTCSLFPCYLVHYTKERRVIANQFNRLGKLIRTSVKTINTEHFVLENLPYKSSISVEEFKEMIFENYKIKSL